jgi:hypothetical protein
LSHSGAWTKFGSRKNSKPEICSKMLQKPTRQMHALLGCHYLTEPPSFLSPTLLHLYKVSIRPRFRFGQ